MGRPRKETGLVELNEAKDLGTSNFGLYAYIHKASQKVAYIGKDSNIQNRARHTVHLFKKNPRQVVDKVLQKDPTKWEYMVLGLFADKEWMEDAEKSLIFSYKGENMCWLNVENELENAY